MTERRNLGRESVVSLIERVDALEPGMAPPDTVATGFPTLDRALGGGARRQDLVVLGGDIGSGKSALAVAISLRAAAAGHPVAIFSGEMDETRLLERALAIEGRTQVDEIRSAELTDERRAALGAAALRIRDLPLRIHSLAGTSLDEALAGAWDDDPALLVIDYLQLLPSPAQRVSLEEDCASAIKALKSMSINRNVACLAVAQLPMLRRDRPDLRPELDDFGALGAVKQHADVALGLYREDMYTGDVGVDGATELIIIKNRNGPTGFIDLYFYRQWMRFEDMLDPDK